MDSFVHLHVHSLYSILDGIASLEGLVNKAVELGQPAIGITEHGNLNSSYKFYKLCTNQKIKPILGYEGYLVNNRKIKDHRGDHIILLAKNFEGFQNLLMISNFASLEGFYYNPRIDWDLLDKYGKNLICLSGCLHGIVQVYLNEERKYDTALENIKLLQTFFKDDFYLELQYHYMEQQDKNNRLLRKIGADYGIKTVATNDVHYVNSEDSSIQDILLALQTHRQLNDPDRMKFKTDELYLKNREELSNFFDKETLDNTLEIADKVNIKLKYDKFRIPKISKEPEKEFLSLIDKGIKEKFFGIIPKQYKERLDYEVNIIKEANLIDYFLIVADYINYAKVNKVYFGSGRGSVCGSLVGYILGIHNIDPIKYNLLFRRFYNPGRKKSLPDIDCDFAERDIHKIIEYIAKKYDIALIGTYQLLNAKASVKAVARIKNIPFKDANYFTSLVPSSKLEECFSYFKFAEEYNNNPIFNNVIQVASKLEGKIYSNGVHAAGIVLNDESLMDLLPLRSDKNTSYKVSCWDMNDLESARFVKFDFLSLTTLDIIRDTMESAGLNFSYFDLPIDDYKTFETIKKGDNVGVFQISSTGINELAMKLEINSIDDIAVLVALYRPGPLNSGLDKTYIKRQRSLEEITYLDPKLESILKNTLGVLIYQEQVIFIAQQLAGFTEEEADNLRKTIAKKLEKAKMYEFESKFLEGCRNNHIKINVAKKIWQWVVEHNSYSFNKSHATAYGTLTYYTAYLKTHYPLEFFTALLNNSMDDKDKMKLYLYNAIQHGIKAYPPDINTSQINFTFDTKTNSIYFGFRAINGIGPNVANKLIEHRDEGFKDIYDFFNKVNKPNSEVDKGSIIALIEAGCFDSLRIKKSQILSITNILMNKKAGKKKYLDIFEINIPIPDLPEFEENILAKMEYDRLGMFLSHDPFTKHKRILEEKTKTIDDFSLVPDKTNLIIGGFVEFGKEFLTKKNKQPMFIGQLQTLGGSVEIVIFPGLYRDIDPPQRGDMLIVYGVLQNISKPSFIINELKKLL